MQDLDFGYVQNEMSLWASQHNNSQIILTVQGQDHWGFPCSKTTIKPETLHKICSLCSVFNQVSLSSEIQLESNFAILVGNIWIKR